MASNERSRRVPPAKEDDCQCVVHVEQLELSRAVSVDDAAWVHPDLWVLAAIMLVACAIAAQLARTRMHVVDTGIPAVPADTSAAAGAATSD